MTNALTVTNLSKSYGARRVLLNCCLQIPEHTLFALVGPGGSGKTTLLRILCGLQKPTAGFYTLLGVHSSSPMVRRARAQTAAILGVPTLIGSLSAEANLEAHARLYGVSVQSAAHLLRLAGLTSASTKKVRNLPLAMRLRLAVCCTMLRTPKLLILDEPLRGLNAEDKEDVRRLLGRLHDEHGLGILATCTEIEDMQDLATAWGVLQNGQLSDTISGPQAAVAADWPNAMQPVGAAWNFANRFQGLGSISRAAVNGGFTT